MKIVFPAQFLEQLGLLGKIDAKNTADGASSILIIYLTTNGVVLGDLIVIGSKAKDHDDKREGYALQSEYHYERRDNLFNPIFSHIRGIGQYLKTLNTGNVRVLVDWGYNINGKSTIDYPVNFLQREALAKTVIAKHNSYAPGTSPLDVYLAQQNIDLAADSTNLAAADDQHIQGEKYHLVAMDETEKRDNLWNPILTIMRNIGEFLKQTLSNNPRALGLYGFVTSESGTSPKLQQSSVMPAGKTVSSNVLLGSVFTNVGKTALEVHKGRKITTDFATVKPGETLGMIKGYSSITVVNPNTLEKGVYTIMVRR